jgi:hypothetical protein
MDAEWIEAVNDATRGRDYHAEHVARISELVIATSALIALFPVDIDERQAAIIRRARVAVSELEQETVIDPDDCNPADYT